MLRVKFGRVAFAVLAAICVLSDAVLAQDMPAQAIAPPDSAPQVAAGAPAGAVPPAAGQQAEAQPPAAQPSAPLAIGPATPAANPLNKGQLQQLVAPIALYPDPLLGEVLMASTYPLEIVEADRWVRDPAHQGLKGDALTNALKAENWDPSVMALVPFPKLLALMAEKLQWTQQLGNAFLAQQSDVMAAVQALRHDAMQAGNLEATPECHCVIQTSGDTISILPSDSQVACVPVYNPRVVYGAWPAPEYPPYFFPIPVGFYFPPGYPIGFWPFVALADYGPLWGWWSLDWGLAAIIIDRGRFGALGGGGFAGSAWVHDPAHRGGVAYADPAVTSRFGAARVASVTAASRTAVGRGAAAGGRFAGARTGLAAKGGAAHAGFAAGRMGGAAHLGGGHAVAHASFGTAHAGGAPHGAAPHGAGAPHGGGGDHHH